MYEASFIPHEEGRCRVDVKFNGEKVPHSPWFVEVKNPNAPLMAPDLVTGKSNSDFKQIIYFDFGIRDQRSVTDL